MTREEALRFRALRSFMHLLGDLDIRSVISEDDEHCWSREILEWQRLTWGPLVRENIDGNK